MKIAMIGQKGMPATYGGVERHVHDLSVHLATLDYDVTTYNRAWYTGGKQKILDGVHLVYIPSIHTKYFDTISHVFFSTIHALFQHYDVIHYHSVGPALLAWIPKLFAPKTKVVITFHSIDRFHQKWGRIAQFVLRLGEYSANNFSDETITVSESLQNYCLDEFNHKTTYIPNAVELCKKPIMDKAIFEQFGIEPNKYITIVSRLIRHKGVHLLIDAFQELKKTSTNPEIQELKLVIIGDSAYKNNYTKTLHEQADSSDDIIFTGFQSGAILHQLMSYATTQVHPSLKEGLPITVLEAMALRTPILVSNIPEHLELIHDPNALFIQNDVSAITENLRNFFTLSFEERQNLVTQNVGTVFNQYTWDVVMPQIMQVYKPIQVATNKPMKQPHTQTA